MVYLDYSATTKADDRVIESFVKANEYMGNPNSLHKLGIKANELITSATLQIANILGVKEKEIIYTSGASESNNLAIKGLDGIKHIITTDLEHSSIYGPVNYLMDRGVDVSFVKLDKGIVNIDELKKMIDNRKTLVTISAVNSETGIKQDIEKLGAELKQYSNVIFHSDMTQAIGKVKFDFKDVDMFSFSAHKFFGIKGIGILVKKEHIKLTPLIHGGKSTTAFRSGTPATSLIVSISKALRLIYESIDEDYEKILNLNNYLKENLQKFEDVHINSNENSIPHILNISVKNIKPETLMHALSEDDIYISTQSACAKGGNPSKAVFALTGDRNLALFSVRISISKKTTKEEIDIFLKSFNKIYHRLGEKK